VQKPKLKSIVRDVNCTEEGSSIRSGGREIKKVEKNSKKSRKKFMCDIFKVRAPW
jgi:hypothetical protein